MSNGLVSILRVIDRPRPSREHYLKDKRRLQAVIWGQHLSIQHNSDEGLAQEILAKSDWLWDFPVDKIEAMDCDMEIPSHLRKRGEIRRLYNRSISDLHRLITGEDMMCNHRNQHTGLHKATNIYYSVGLVSKWLFSILMIRELAAIF